MALRGTYAAAARAPSISQQPRSTHRGPWAARPQPASGGIIARPPAAALSVLHLSTVIPQRAVIIKEQLPSFVAQAAQAMEACTGTQSTPTSWGLGRFWVAPLGQHSSTINVCTVVSDAAFAAVEARLSGLSTLDPLP